MQIERAQRRVRLRDLETLVAVVQAGGMRKASLALHLSQPAVSKAVAELEDALGVRLLERGRRGVEPTLFGDALVHRSRALIDDLQSALRELAYLADPAAGEVKLGAMETLQAGLVGAAMQAQLKVSPRMRFVLEVGQSPDLIEHFLAQRKVDLVVARPFSLPLPRDVQGEPLFRDQLLVVAGPEHRFARRRRLSLAELQDETWILSRTESMPGGPAADGFAQAGLAMPERLIRGGGLVMRQNLLASSACITCVPHSLMPFGQARNHFKVLPVTLPLWRTPTMVLTLRGRTLNPAAQAFLTTLRRLAAPLVTPAEAQNPTPAGAAV